MVTFFQSRCDCDRGELLKSTRSVVDEELTFYPVQTYYNTKLKKLRRTAGKKDGGKKQ